MKRQFSILFVNQSLSIGGAEVFDRDLLCQFQANGMRVSAVTNNHRFQLMLEKEKIDVHSMPVVIDIIGDWKGLIKALVLWPFFVGLYVKLLFQLRQTIDGIVMTGFPEKVFVTPVARWFSIPVVWLEFGPLDSVFSKFFGLPRWLYNSVAHLPTRVIVPSQHTRKALQKGTKISSKRITVIPCGRSIDLKKYQHLLPYQKPTIVCVSRLERGKGQDLLIQAFAKVRLEFPDVVLRIIGQGDFLPVLQQLVVDLKLETSVEFKNWVKDPLVEVKKSLLTIFPSVWPLEGFGLSMIEAMAMGKAVVGFDRGPTNEIIVNHQTGLLAKNGNIDDLATEMIQLLTHDQQRLEMEKQAKQVFLERYFLPNLMPKYIMVLEKAFR